MIEKHADPIDEATALAASLTESAVAAARRANARESHPDFDGESCIECGDIIPSPRLALGKIRCIHCQTALERRARHQVKTSRGNDAWPGTEA